MSVDDLFDEKQECFYRSLINYGGAIGSLLLFGVAYIIPPVSKIVNDVAYITSSVGIIASTCFSINGTYYALKANDLEKQIKEFYQHSDEE